MPCGEPFRFSHLPREMAAASPEDQVALWERNFRDIEDFVSGWPCGSALPWASFTQDTTITFSAGNPINTSGAWDLEFTNNDGFTPGPSTGYITVPDPGVYLWAFEVYLPIGEDTLTYTTTPTNGTACGVLNLEVSPVASAFGKPNYYHYPLFYRAEGAEVIKVWSGAVALSASDLDLYIESSLVTVPFLTLSDADGSIAGHFTIVQIDPVSLAPPQAG